MDLGGLATALAVVREGSIRGAARLIGRPPSSVGDAFERFEDDLGLRLAWRADRSLSLTLSGQTLRRASDRMVDALSRMQALAGNDDANPVEGALAWAARQGIALTTLSHFDAVLSEGSIRRGARRCGLSQPQLSRQMARLEVVFGGPLLARSTGGCEASCRGLALRVIIRDVDAWITEFVAPTSRRYAAAQRPVRFGAVIPLSYESRLATRLAAAVARWPTAGAPQDLLVSSSTAEDLIEGLKTGRYDLALLDAALSQTHFESREVFSSELVLVGPPRTLDPSLPLEALLANRSVAVPSHRSGLRQRIWEALGTVLDGAGKASTRFVDVDALSIVIRLVLDHGYLSILPIDAVAALGDGVATARFREAPRVSFHLVWRLSTASRDAARIATLLADGEA